MAHFALLDRATPSSTPHQRLAIRCVLFDRCLSIDRVGEVLRDVFQRADVPFQDGVDLDTQLKAMTRDQAARLLLAAREVL